MPGRFGASSQTATRDLVWRLAWASVFVLSCRCRGTTCAVVWWLASRWGRALIATTDKTHCC